MHLIFKVTIRKRSVCLLTQRGFAGEYDEKYIRGSWKLFFFYELIENDNRRRIKEYKGTSEELLKEAEVKLHCRKLR